MTTQPQKYETISGAVWDTDIKWNDSLTNKSGDGCLEFMNTTPANDPGMRYTDFIPVIGGDPYSCYTWAQADSVAAGNTVSCWVYWYDSAKSYISTSYTYAAVLPAISTWYLIGGIIDAPSTARFAKPGVSKNNTNFTAYFDNLAFSKVPVCFFARLGSAAGYNTTEQIEFDTEDYDYGSNYSASGTHRFTAPSDGIYAISACAYTDGLDAGEYFTLWAYANGSSWLSGSTARAHADGDFSASVLSTTQFLGRGSYVDIRLIHDTGGVLVLAGDATFNHTYFSVAKVE